MFCFSEEIDGFFFFCTLQSALAQKQKLLKEISAMEEELSRFCSKERNIVFFFFKKNLFQSSERDPACWSSLERNLWNSVDECRNASSISSRNA